MDYSLLVGIHDIEFEKELQLQRGGVSPPAEENIAIEFHQQQASDLDSGGDEPPDSPIPSVGAFTTNSVGLNLDDEFFAIPSSEGNCNIWFMQLSFL